MQTFCPKCGAKLGADESLIGRQAQCGKCGTRFTVTPLPLPGADAPASQAQTADKPLETKTDEPSSVPLPPIGGAMAPIGAARPETEVAEAEEPTADATPVAADPPPALPPKQGGKVIAPRLKSETPEAGAEGGEAVGTNPCPKCGANIPANSVLCTQCGTFLKETIKPEAKTGKKRIWQVIGGVLLVLLVVGVTLGRKVYRAYRGISDIVQEQAQQPPPGPPGAPGGPPGMPGGPPGPPPAKAPPKAAPPAFGGTLPAIRPEELEVMAKLPAQDPSAPSSDGVKKPATLAMPPMLMETVNLKGPSRDRHQVDIAPRISPKTRLITLRLLWQQEELDQPVPLNAESVKVTTDVGPGVLYGIEFLKFGSMTGWQPRGATRDAGPILESVQMTTRYTTDFTTDLLSSGALLGRAAFGKWHDLVTNTTSGRLTAVSVLNQFVSATNQPLQTESGSFFHLDGQVVVHALLPSTATLVRLQLGEQRPMTFPIEALASVPTTSQPEPLPFINATVDKARQFLDAPKAEDVIAGAQLLTEAGNLDAQRKLKETAFKNWASGVTQLLAHANIECRAAGVETILRSHGVEPRLRAQLLTAAVHEGVPEVRVRAAELLGEQPSLIDVAFKEGMEIFQKLLADTNSAVRAAAHVSNCRLAMLGDDSTFDFLKDGVQKGLMDPSPGVRFALLRSMPPLQYEEERTAMFRLSQMLQHVRLSLFDPNEGVRAQAAKTILAIQSPASASIVTDALQQIPEKTADLFALASFEVVVATEATLPFRVPALGNKQAQTVLANALEKYLENPAPRLRQSASRVLGTLDPEVANNALATAATNSDLGVRLTAFSSFIGTDRKFAAPSSVFGEGLVDPEPRVRGAAFALLDEIKDDPEAVATVASNVVARVPSPAVRIEVAKKFAALAATNGPILMAMNPFLGDKDENVWAVAIAPWSKTTLRFPWAQIEPAWKLLSEQPSPRRRYAFLPLRLAIADTNAPMNATAALAPEAIVEATKWLGDPDTVVREQALLFVAPSRRAEDVPVIETILTDPKADLTLKSKNELLVALAKPSSNEDFAVVDRIRPATEEDKKRERDALNAATMMPPGSKPGTKTSFLPVNYRVAVPTTSLSGMYLMTKWAASQNPSANAVANYLLKLIPTSATRSWLLPSERAILLQSLRKLGEVPTVSAPAKTMLAQLEARFPAGAAAKMLTAEQTQGATDSVDTLAAFIGPRKKPMIIATFKHGSGAMIDVWFNADEAVPDKYPNDATDLNQAWKFVSKLDGSRMDPIDKETAARLEWAAANAPKDKLRAALEKVAQAEGDLAPLGRRLALEGLVLLAEKGDAEAEAAAIKLGWLKM